MRLADERTQRKIKARLGVGPKHVDSQGRHLSPHEFSDDHLLNLVKMKVRRRFGAGARNFFVDRWADFLKTQEPWLFELNARNVPTAMILEYAVRVCRGQCDECGAERATRRGPSQRLQCDPCAAKWEMRCTSCGRRPEVSELPECACGIFFMWVPR